MNYCPECGRALWLVSCKAYCLTPDCPLFRKIIENCSGD